jgi:hypothetical protein
MRTSTSLAISATIVLGFAFGHTGCNQSGIPGGNGAGGSGSSQGGVSNTGGAANTAGTAGSISETGGSGTGGSPTCSSSVECGADTATPVCLLSTHRCVECLENSDCSANAADAGSSLQLSYCFHNACLNFVPCEVTNQCLPNNGNASGGSPKTASGGSSATAGVTPSATSGGANASGNTTGGATGSGGNPATGGNTSIIGVCDLTLRHCVQCSQDNDCRSQTNVQGINCRVNRCRASCGSDLDCIKIDSGLLCNLTLSLCTEACDSNSDCYPGYQCDTNVSKCVPAG